MYSCFMEKEQYIQVGITAMRTPDGKFLPSRPIYIKVGDDELEKGGLTQFESMGVSNVSGFFGEKRKEHKTKWKWSKAE